MITLLAMIACDDRRESTTPPLSTPSGDAACDVPGSVCRWLGVPGVALFSGEGTDRSERFATATDPGGTFLFLPVDITFAADGTAYYPDYNNHRVRRVGIDDIVTTVSGLGMIGDGPNLPPGSPADCWDGCPALESLWNHPADVGISATDPSLLWVAEEDNGRVNVIDVRTDVMFWWADGLAKPSAVAVADDGTVYVSEPGRADAPGSAHVRRIKADGVAEIIAGEPEVAMPRGLALDGDILWIADGGGAIRWIDVAAAACVSDASACVVGDLFDSGEFGAPNDVAVGLQGEVYVTDVLDDCVRVFRSAGSSATLDVFAGRCGASGFGGDGGPATDALFDFPAGVAVDPAGNVYVADSSNHVIRRIIP